MKKVLAAITCVNLWDRYTRASLESLFNQELNDIELKVLLLDNGSIDNTKDQSLLLKSQRENFDVIRFDQNQGLQKACNAILDYGFQNGFDCVFIGNNDTLFHKQVITSLVGAYSALQSDTVLVSAINVKGECATPESVFNIDPQSKAYLSSNEHPDFSAFMVSKRFYDEVGEADEGFYPALFEDNDLHRRIKMAGLYAFNCPTALFYHYASGTIQSPEYETGRVQGDKFNKNRQYYTTKWGGSPSYEQFTRPFGNQNNSVKYTQQKPV